MGLETGNFPSDLIATNPTASDPKSQGDDHLRLLKNVFKMTLPNVTGAITATHTQLNYVTGVTSSIQGQFAAVQVQFTSAGALITGLQSSKADLAGATYAGTHDFSGGITKVAPPTLADHAATMLYVQQQAFAAVLPSQPGNAGRYITTDGANASWADLSGGVTTTTTATSLVLTVTSRQLQVITTTVDDLTVTLPNATTISAGGPVFTIYNKGARSFTVRTNTDMFLVNIQPGQIATFYCFDKTTAGGFWFIGNETFTGGALTDYAIATGVVINAVSSSDTSITRLSDTVAVAAYRGASSFMQAVSLTISAVSIIAGPVLTVNGVASTVPSVAALTSTKVVLTYSGTSQYPQAVVLTLLAGALSPGTIVTVNTQASNVGTSVAALSATQAIITYVGASSYAQTSVLDISGSAITPSVTPLILNAATSQRPVVAALTATKALVVFLGASNFSNHVVVDITGSSMIPGAVTAFNAIAGGRTAIVTLSSTRALYAYLSTGGQLSAHVMDVAGTTVTPSAVANGEAGANGNQIGLALLSSGRVVAAYSTATSSRAALITIAGSVATVGANFMVLQTGNNVSTAGLTTTKAIVFFAGASGYATAQIIEKSE